MFIDTHSHLYLHQFDNDIDIVIANAKANNVTQIYLPNIDNSTTKRMLDLEKKDAKMFKSMMGLHPGSVDKNYKLELDIMRKELEQPKKKRAVNMNIPFKMTFINISFSILYHTVLEMYIKKDLHFYRSHISSKLC